MKNLLPYFAGLCGIAVCCFLVSAKSIEPNPETTGFIADSGYITPANVLKLLKIDPADTLYTINLNAPATDTLGKYYKMANGNYIASVNVIALEGYMLCEARPDGTVLKKEKYTFNNFECCWKSKDDCLRRYGNYYTFLTCGTGTDYCGGYLHIFKEVTPQHWQESIPKSIWVWAGPDTPYYYISITSTMEMVNNSVIMHYNNILYEQLEDSKIKTTKEIEKFDITWLYQNDKWTVTDSVKLKEILKLR